MESYSRIYKRWLDQSDILAIVGINRPKRRTSYRGSVPDQWTETIILPTAENSEIDCCRSGKWGLQRPSQASIIPNKEGWTAELLKKSGQQKSEKHPTNASLSFCVIINRMQFHRTLTRWTSKLLSGCWETVENRKAAMSLHRPVLPSKPSIGSMIHQSRHHQSRHRMHRADYHMNANSM